MSKTETVVNVNSISRISAGTVIKGEILSPNDIRIDGTFEGRIQSKGRVVVGIAGVLAFSTDLLAGLLAGIF